MTGATASPVGPDAAHERILGLELLFAVARAGTFDVVVNAPGNGSIHVLDLSVISGTFTGSVDLSLAALHRVPLGSIVGSFTIAQIAIRHRRAGPAPAARGPAFQGNPSDAVRDGQASFPQPTPDAGRSGPELPATGRG